MSEFLGGEGIMIINGEKRIFVKDVRVHIEADSWSEEFVRVAGEFEKLTVVNATFSVPFECLLPEFVEFVLNPLNFITAAQCVRVAETIAFGSWAIRCAEEIAREGE